MNLNGTKAPVWSINYVNMLYIIDVNLSDWGLFDCADTCALTISMHVSSNSNRSILIQLEWKWIFFFINKLNPSDTFGFCLDRNESSHLYQHWHSWYRFKIFSILFHDFFSFLSFKFRLWKRKNNVGQSGSNESFLTRHRLTSQLFNHNYENVSFEKSPCIFSCQEQECSLFNVKQNENNARSSDYQDIWYIYLSYVELRVQVHKFIGKTSILIYWLAHNFDK